MKFIVKLTLTAYLLVAQQLAFADGDKPDSMGMSGDDVAHIIRKGTDLAEGEIASIVEVLQAEFGVNDRGKILVQGALYTRGFNGLTST